MNIKRLTLYCLGIFSIFISLACAYSAGPPSIYSVTPVVGINDSEITLASGYPGFGDHEGAVYIDESLINVISWNDDKIVAQVPPAIVAGTHNLTVRNSIGELSRIRQVRTQPAPEIFSITPKNIYPGVSRMCVVGNNFGTMEENWRVGYSDLSVGSTEITSAAWSNKEICFTAPENSTPIVNLRITSASVAKQFSYATVPTTYDSYVKRQYYLGVISAQGGWSVRSSSPSVVVAVIDDGIYLNHPDLKNNIWVNEKDVIGNKIDDDKNGYADDTYGWNFIDNNGEVTVKGSHGTHVAGIIGAVGNNGQGIVGISSSVKLMSLIACDASGCNKDAVIDAIKYATDNRADVINLSLGSKGTMGFSVDYDAAVRYAYNKGVVIVAASGNGDIESAQSVGGDLKNIPQSPICNDLSQNAVLGVSGVDDQQNALRWANYGICVDVYAPGIQIFSTAVPALDDGEFYSSVSGTSFSAPIVAGLAALIKAQYPNITNRDIIDRIVQTSSNNLGVKTINMFVALSAPYVPSGIGSVVPEPVSENSVLPKKTDVAQESKIIKPEVQVDSTAITTNTAPIFSYNTKLATSTPTTSMSAISSAKLRSCPAKTCDVKGVYPADSVFIVKEKYGAQEIWYRGEMPDGNDGWISSELLTLAATQVTIDSEPAKDALTSYEEEGLEAQPPAKQKSFWARVISWFRFW